MFSVAQLLDSAKEKGNIESDYRLAKVIGISHGTMSGYRSGKSMPDERVTEQLCALSGDDVAVVAAQLQAERSRTAEGKTMWMMIAKRLAGGASTAILSVLFTAILIAGFAPPAYAKNDTHRFALSTKFLYIVLSTILSVPQFLAVRLRRFAPFMCALACG